MHQPLWLAPAIPNSAPEEYLYVGGNNLLQNLVRNTGTGHNDQFSFAEFIPLAFSGNWSNSATVSTVLVAMIGLYWLVDD